MAQTTYSTPVPTAGSTDGQTRTQLDRRERKWREFTMKYPLYATLKPEDLWTTPGEIEKLAHCSQEEKRFISLRHDSFFSADQPQYFLVSRLRRDQPKSKYTKSGLGHRPVLCPGVLPQDFQWRRFLENALLEVGDLPLEEGKERLREMYGTLDHSFSEVEALERCSVCRVAQETEERPFVRDTREFNLVILPEHYGTHDRKGGCSVWSHLEAKGDRDRVYTLYRSEMMNHERKFEPYESDTFIGLKLTISCTFAYLKGAWHDLGEFDSRDPTRYAKLLGRSHYIYWEEGQLISCSHYPLFPKSFQEVVRRKREEAEAEALAKDLDSETTPTSSTSSLPASIPKVKCD